MKRVLLIEDEQWLADLYRDILKDAGYNVHHTATAQDGLDIVDQEKIAVIVLDLLLPAQNGIALLQELRSYPDLAHIPIIVQSNIDPTQAGLSKESWKAYGVAAYIFKAVSRPKELVRAVNRVVPT